MVNTISVREPWQPDLVSPVLNHLPVATVTNDIFTREDQEFLIRNEALPPSRILAIETGGCPHAAIREDISANLGALETLQVKYGCQLLFVESGGDNLAANYSRELADYIIYVIDVAVCTLFLGKFYESESLDRIAGRGQDSTQGRAGYLAIRPSGDQQGTVICLFSSRMSHRMLKPSAKIDIAEYVNASLEVMQRDARIMRGDGPTVFTSIKKDQGVEDVIDLILAAWRTAGRPGTPSPVAL